MYVMVVVFCYNEIALHFTFGNKERENKKKIFLFSVSPIKYFDNLIF